MSIPLKLTLFLVIQTAGTLAAVGAYYAYLQRDIQSYRAVFAILTKDAKQLHRRIDNPAPLRTSGREMLSSFSARTETAGQALTRGGEVQGVTCKPLPDELRDLLHEANRRWKLTRAELTGTVASSEADEKVARKRLHDVFGPWQAEIGRMEVALGRRAGTIRAQMTNTLLLVGGFNLLFLGVVLWLVRTYVSKPIRAVGSAATRVAEGDYSVPVPVSGHDEISSLASEFNRMSDRLQQTVGALRESERRLTEKADALEQYSYAAAHDLQEPVRVISLYVQMLQRRFQLPREAQQLTSQIRTSAERMQRLVSDLLVHSRSVHEQPKSGPSDPNEAVAEALLMLDEAVVSSGASIHCETMPWVMADQADLDIVFRNLIANALKYSGDRPPRVEIGSVVENETCTIVVRDQGIGIAPEYHDRVFGLFKRLHGREVPGTGVGLAVARNIVEKHGGRIWVESDAGRGATFLFQLRIATTALKVPA